MEASGIRGIPSENIILSSEFKKEKSDGSLFSLIAELKAGHKVLHIGDNEKSDIENATARGFDTFYVMNPYKMIVSSSIGMLPSYAKTAIDNIKLGLILARNFSDPFALGSTKGKVPIRRPEDFGFSVFGGGAYKVCGMAL